MIFVQSTQEDQNQIPMGDPENSKNSHYLTQNVLNMPVLKLFIQY